ncbi:MAG: radical SAM protein [Candidatus Tantalella remota]|nr:radical SAM protein [Candidatus Tantalella remota]
MHATLLPEEILGKSDSIDYVVTGEGEKIFLRMLEYLHADEIVKIKHIPGVAFQEGRRTVVNPYDNSYRLSETELPIPLFEIFPMKKYVAQATYSKVFPTFSTIASRGCPYNCAFCEANITTGKNVRYTPVPRIIREIRELKEHYGARGIMFLDSTFTLDAKWVRDFCTAYIDSGLNLPWACNSRVDTVDEDLLTLMKKAGAWSVLFGLESANQRSLDLIGKETTVEQNRSAVRLALKLGFYVYTSYILGLPGENEKDVMNTIRFARSLGNHLCIFYLPVPFPKTRLELMAKKEGGLSANIRNTDYNQWDYSNPVYINPRIGNKKMQSLLKQAFLDFYTNPVVIMRNLKELLLLRQSPYKFWLGLRGLHGLFRR